MAWLYLQIRRLWRVISKSVKKTLNPLVIVHLYYLCKSWLPPALVPKSSQNNPLWRTFTNLLKKLYQKWLLVTCLGIPGSFLHTLSGPTRIKFWWYLVGDSVPGFGNQNSLLRNNFLLGLIYTPVQNTLETEQGTLAKYAKRRVINQQQLIVTVAEFSIKFAECRV